MTPLLYLLALACGLVPPAFLAVGLEVGIPLVRPEFGRPPVQRILWAPVFWAYIGAVHLGWLLGLNEIWNSWQLVPDERQAFMFAALVPYLMGAVLLMRRTLRRIPMANAKRSSPVEPTG